MVQYLVENTDLEFLYAGGEPQNEVPLSGIFWGFYTVAGGNNCQTTRGTDYKIVLVPPSRFSHQIHRSPSTKFFFKGPTN